MKIERVGNWYQVEIDGELYNVVIQKDKNSIECHPDSIIIFDASMFGIVDLSNTSIWEKVQGMMEKMDWKYDMVDEE